MLSTESKKRLVASTLAFFLLRDFEDFQPRSYNDGVGKRTIGYGHVILPREVFEEPISVTLAERLLMEDVAKHQEIIYRHVKVPLTQQQHDALVCFAFNIGERQFADSSLLKRLNEGKYDEVPVRLGMWIHGTDEATGKKKVLRGLVARRQAEIDMWNGVYSPDKKYK